MTEDWKTGPHQLTYRQVERTFDLHHRAGQRPPGRRPLARPGRASSTPCWKPASRPSTRTRPGRWPSTGPTWKPSPARRPAAAATAPTPKPPGDTAAATAPARKTSSSTATTCQPEPWSAEENGPPVPELARRVTLTSCRLDPARAMVPVLDRMPADGIRLGDILDDSGYAHRTPGPGPCRCAPPEPSSSRTCTRRPRTPRHPRRRDHF